MNPHIFREYDIRGVVGRDLTDESVYDLARAIGTLSYGVPRDIIRRCDEYIARTEAAAGSPPGQLAAELRRLQAGLGYELHQLSKTQVEGLSGEPLNTALAAQRLLGNGFAGNPEPHYRLILSLWLLALIELAATLPDNELWRSTSESLSRRSESNIRGESRSTSVRRASIAKTMLAPLRAEVSSAAPTEAQARWARGVRPSGR